MDSSVAGELSGKGGGGLDNKDAVRMSICQP